MSMRSGGRLLRSVADIAGGSIVNRWLAGWRTTGMSPFEEGILAMGASHLRLYYGPTDDSANIEVCRDQKDRETCTLPLMDVLPLLGDAVQSQRTWLRDFKDDEITISMDLYEMILAYQHYRRPSA